MRSSDWSSDVCSSDLESLAGAMQSSPAFRAPMSGFASLPDRGELLAYEKTRQVKHKGAYTAYPVAISEAHALRAMQSGQMVVNAPNGEPTRRSEERRVGKEWVSTCE